MRRSLCAKQQLQNADHLVRESQFGEEGLTGPSYFLAQKSFFGELWDKAGVQENPESAEGPAERVPPGL